MAKKPLSAFTSGAAYYEVLFDPVARLEREGPLLRKILEVCPGKRVLDLACGTGHHAAFLSGIGARVTACDLSEEMIAYARAKHAESGVVFLPADMREAVEGSWDLALCLGNSLSLLPTVADLRKALRTVARILVPGGRYVAQVLNYVHPEMQTPKHRIVTKPMDDMAVTAVKSLVPQSGHTLLCLTFFAERDEAFATVAESAVLMHVDVPMLEAAAHDAGLLIDGCYGGFGETPFDAATSQDLIMVLRRPT